jgi:hypothetical protein
MYQKGETKMTRKTADIIAILDSIDSTLYRNGRMGRLIEAVAAASGPAAAEEEAIERLSNVTVGLLLTNRPALQWLADIA